MALFLAICSISGIGLLYWQIAEVTERNAEIQNSLLRYQSEKEILESFEQPTQMKIQKQFLTKLAENLDDMNTECIKLKSIIKKKLKSKT